MRVSILSFVVTAALLTTGNAAFGLAFSDVVVHDSVGSGSNQALLVIDFQQGDAAVFSYQFDGVKTTADMLNDVAAGSTRLSVFWHPSFVNTGLFGIGFDADGDGGTFTVGSAGAATETGSADDPDDLYHEGWFTGFWSYWTSDDGETWTPRIIDGVADVNVTDGSWHGLGWDDSFAFFNLFNDPNDAAGLALAPDNIVLEDSTVIPEPTSALLVLMGSGALAQVLSGRRRRARR